MTSIYGVALIVLAIGMILVGRAPKGMDSAPFLKVWVVGQAYIIATIVCLVIGTTLIIQSLSG
jgi:hypothetical protein